MPHAEEWLVEGKVLYSRITDPYTDEDVVAGSDIVVQHLDQTTNEVLLIINTVGLTSFPRNIVSSAGSVQKFMQHPNLRQLIVVSDNAAVRFVSLLATQVQRGKVILYKTLEDALTFAAKQSPEIADQIKLPRV